MGIMRNFDDGMTEAEAAMNRNKNNFDYCYRIVSYTPGFYYSLEENVMECLKEMNKSPISIVYKSDGAVIYFRR